MLLLKSRRLEINPRPLWMQCPLSSRSLVYKLQFHSSNWKLFPLNWIFARRSPGPDSINKLLARTVRVLFWITGRPRNPRLIRFSHKVETIFSLSSLLHKDRFSDLIHQFIESRTFSAGLSDNEQFWNALDPSSDCKQPDNGIVDRVSNHRWYRGWCIQLMIVCDVANCSSSADCSRPVFANHARPIRFIVFVLQPLFVLFPQLFVYILFPKRH